jgi:hypothetical protein
MQPESPLRGHGVSVTAPGDSRRFLEDRLAVRHPAQPYVIEDGLVEVAVVDGREATSLPLHTYESWLVP